MAPIIFILPSGAVGTQSPSKTALTQVALPPTSETRKVTVADTNFMPVEMIAMSALCTLPILRTFLTVVTTIRWYIMLPAGIISIQGAIATSHHTGHTLPNLRMYHIAAQTLRAGLGRTTLTAVMRAKHTLILTGVVTWYTLLAFVSIVTFQTILRACHAPTFVLVVVVQALFAPALVAVLAAGRAGLAHIIHQVESLHTVSAC